MTRFIASLALAASLLAGIASANATPGSGLAERAQHGALSPHGIFDGR